MDLLNKLAVMLIETVPSVILTLVFTWCFIRAWRATHEDKPRVTWTGYTGVQESISAEPGPGPDELIKFQYKCGWCRNTSPHMTLEQIDAEPTCPCCHQHFCSMACLTLHTEAQAAYIKDGGDPKTSPTWTPDSNAHA